MESLNNILKKSLNKEFLSAIISNPREKGGIVKIKIRPVEHKDNILFIDASNEFEKQKNQNKLLPEHLDKIVAAFEKRENIEKYAHVATLQEVKDNDYNLNIPRYVDTFEAEAEIDLDAIAKQLQALEHDSQKTDAVIADFCKELGIVSPFAEVK